MQRPFEYTTQNTVCPNEEKLESPWTATGEAKDQSPENLSAQTRYMQWYIGIFAHPIFLGDFPKVIKDMVEKKSKEQKYRKSRLPRLSSEDVALIKGTADFLGLNHYTTRMVEAASQHMGNMVEEIEHEYTGNYHDDSDVHAYKKLKNMETRGFYSFRFETLLTFFTPTHPGQKPALLGCKLSLGVSKNYWFGSTTNTPK